MPVFMKLFLRFISFIFKGAADEDQVIRASGSVSQGACPALNGSTSSFRTASCPVTPLLLAATARFPSSKSIQKTGYYFGCTGSLLPCTGSLWPWHSGFSLRWLLFLRSTGSRARRLQELWPIGLAASWHVVYFQNRD